MDKVKIIEVKESILADNDKDADLLREQLKKDHVFYINIMSSPGSGKTTLLLGLLKRLREKYGLKCAVMEADIDSDVDAQAIEDAGFHSIQLHTGGMCHLDADMSRQGLEELGYRKYDAVFLENVGNLVCPAEFDTGAALNAVILSVPEGDDKPYKYPLVFEKCKAVIINKIDSLPAFDFDMANAMNGIKLRNPDAVIFPVSALTGEGMDELAGYFSDAIKN